MAGISRPRDQDRRREQRTKECRRGRPAQVAGDRRDDPARHRRNRAGGCEYRMVAGAQLPPYVAVHRRPRTGCSIRTRCKRSSPACWCDSSQRPPGPTCRSPGRSSRASSSQVVESERVPHRVRHRTVERPPCARRSRDGHDHLEPDRRRTTRSRVRSNRSRRSSPRSYRAESSCSWCSCIARS